LHAVLCAAGFNIRWLLRMIVKKGHRPFFAPATGQRFGAHWPSIARDFYRQIVQVRRNAFSAGVKLNFSGRATYRGCAGSKLTQVFYLPCLNIGQGKGKVIAMEMLGKIRRMHSRDKVLLHEIAKRTGLSRNTVRCWLRKSQEVRKLV
jgi:hypothetical protein